ncbi:Plug domain-containing protein [Aquisalimonas sp.]|uniref:Plug domain-containing protein n=1 Tax=Aquisalimonas sp. TaxID=1872621 RepID=UPI0025BBBA42|nr:Plug domain-containing protein [Aquisalimonas sp.]
MQAHGGDAVRLDPLTVTSRLPASTLPIAEETAAELERVPGGVSLVDLDTVREGRTANLEDAFGTTPGVYARSRFGQDETRLSIRGSGPTQTFNNRGIRLLRDGLPVTEADGNTRNQLMDPLTVDHIAVYRGANAMGYGAATLGGAINMVSPTGYGSDPLTLRAETGSFGYQRLQTQPWASARMRWVRSPAPGRMVFVTTAASRRSAATATWGSSTTIAARRGCTWKPRTTRWNCPVP